MPNRHPLVLDVGTTKEIPDQDDLLYAGGALVKNGVSSGKTKTVPSGYTLVAHGPYDVEGTLVVEGDMVIL